MLLNRFTKLLRRRKIRALKRTGRLLVGAYTYGDPAIVLHQGDTGRVEIGRYCSIGAEVEIMPGGGHRVDWVTTYPLRGRFGLPGAFSDGHPASKGDVKVGNDVWIGRGARILSGVVVGDGAVIAAYSVVTKDVPPYAIAAGVPAKTVRFRFDAVVIDQLQRLRWWDWPHELVIERTPLLCAPPSAELLGWCHDD